MHTVVVYHLIHVTTPYRRIAKLVIDEVPETIRTIDIVDACDAAGYTYGEFGIPWANHCIASLTEDFRADYPRLIGAIRHGEYEARYTWQQLSALAQEPV